MNGLRLVVLASALAFTATLTPVTVHAAKKAKAAAAPKVIEAASEGSEDVINAKLVVDSSAESQGLLPGETLSAAIPANTTESSALAAPVAHTTASTVATIPSVPVAPKLDTSKLPENEIPVLATVVDSKKTEGGSFAKLMATLVVLVMGLGAASFGLKKYMKKTGINKINTRIQILTQHHLGPKKSIAIIQVAGEAILIGITDHNISMLKTLALIDDEIPETVPNHFGNTLDQFDDEALDNHEEGDEEEQFHNGPINKKMLSREPSGNQDNFAMRGLKEIRDTVTRSKNTRRPS